MEALNQFISNVIEGNNVAAKELFNQLVAERATEALAERKQEIATKLFQTEEKKEDDEKEDEDNEEECSMKEESELDEASYSAKAARAGKDIGKPGKQFAKIAKSAAERYGSEESGKRVAGAILAKLRKEEAELEPGAGSHLNLGGKRVENTRSAVLAHVKKTFPNTTDIEKNSHGWGPKGAKNWK